MKTRSHMLTITYARYDEYDDAAVGSVPLKVLCSRRSDLLEKAQHIANIVIQCH